MKAVYLIAVPLVFATFSCERHEWEETKALHKSHEPEEPAGTTGDEPAEEVAPAEE